MQCNLAVGYHSYHTFTVHATKFKPPETTLSYPNKSELSGIEIGLEGQGF